MSKSSVRDWEVVAAFVATFPADDGEGACDVSVEVGRGEDGLWYVRTQDDAGGSDDFGDTGYDTREAAERAASEYALDSDEAQPGEDAEDYLARCREETIGAEDPAGAWCVYWTTALDDAGPHNRYATQEQAEAATARANDLLRKGNPGTLLCGYEVRTLNEGSWVVPEER
jgi:hypothetical protein